MESWKDKRISNNRLLVRYANMRVKSRSVVSTPSSGLAHLNPESVDTSCNQSGNKSRDKSRNRSNDMSHDRSRLN